MSKKNRQNQSKQNEMECKIPDIEEIRQENVDVESISLPTELSSGSSSNGPPISIWLDETGDIARFEGQSGKDRVWPVFIYNDDLTKVPVEYLMDLVKEYNVTLNISPEMLRSSSPYFEIIGKERNCLATIIKYYKKLLVATVGPSKPSTSTASTSTDPQ